MQTIKDEWEDFREKAIPPDVGDPQLRDMRTCFYAGVESLFYLLNEFAKTNPPREELNQHLDTLRGEASQYFEELLKK
jgi:hypothetical protein